MMLVRVRSANAAHVTVFVYTGPEPGRLVYNGTLRYTAQEWPAVREAFRQIAEVQA